MSWGNAMAAGRAHSEYGDRGLELVNEAQAILTDVCVVNVKEAEAELLATEWAKDMDEAARMRLATIAVLMALPGRRPLPPLTTLLRPNSENEDEL